MPSRPRQKPKRARKSNAPLLSSAASAGRDTTSSNSHQPDEELKRELPATDRCPRWFTPAVGFVAIAGFLIRCWHVLLTSSAPSIQQASGDARGYLNWAAQLAQGDWYGSETFYQAPLYPYLLGVLVTLGGMNITWMRMFQAILGALSTALIGGASRRFFDPPTGLAAAVMLALYGPAIYYDGIIQKASLAMFLLSALIYLLSLMADDGQRSLLRSVVLTFASGFVLGLLCLTRENALVWIPFILIWIWTTGMQQQRLARVKLSVGFALGIFAVLFPVAARNASVGGEWSPTTFQSGPNFYIGNGIHATGVYEPLVVGHQSPEFERADAQMLAESFVGRPLTAREVSKFWATRALTEILERPGQWCLLTGRKLLMTINNYEVPDVDSPYVHAYWSPPLRVLITCWGFGLLFPLSAVGLYLALPQIKRVWILPAMTLSMVVAVAAFFILGRYRLPLALLIVPFAAYAVTHFVHGFSTSRRRLITIGIFTLTLIISFLPVHNFRGLTASAYMNTGVAYGQAGDAQQSLLWIGRSIELRGETAVGLYNLAGAQLLAGHRNAAFESLEKARRLNPSFIEVELTLARMYEEQGDLTDAELHYRTALGIDPSNREAAQKAQSLRASNTYQP